LQLEAFFTDKRSWYFVDRHMRDETLLSRAHMKEIEKDKVKFGEAPKLVHF
jgi:hypothetical protein